MFGKNSGYLLLNHNLYNLILNGHRAFLTITIENDYIYLTLDLFTNFSEEWGAGYTNSTT